ncbi:transposase [Algoriphagus sp. NF]|jgi:transposase-like protein|uniref:IS66 family insertion sequence element accessory protein TnpA n=1 Tax=Algoriphagus TaxID=246875 RepID=UPI00047D4948|nr:MULTISPECIES: transposase [Algoriphagus]MDE0562012.1 transposase [Algoriphagus sp. NF]
MIEDLIKNARLSSSGRKLLTSQQKAFIVEDWESSGLSCPEYCRRHGLITSQVYSWRTLAKSGAIMSIKNQGDLHSKAELEMLRKENEELKKALGESTLDIKILKKKLEMDQLRNKKLNRYPGNSE